MIAGAVKFEVFGPQHQLVLGVFALGLVGVVVAGRLLRRRGPDTTRRVCRVLAVLLGTMMTALQVSEWVIDGFHTHGNLPLQVCDLTWMVLVAALWTGSRTWIFLGYYWGLTLSMQGVLTPELHGVWPSFAFLSFWAQHLPLVWGAAFLTFGLAQGPTWRDYRRSLALTLGWAASVMVINGVLGSNYGYLNRKPAAASILDTLPPWPGYVLVEIVIVALGWALITLPWTWRRRAPEPVSGAPME